MRRGRMVREYRRLSLLGLLVTVVLWLVTVAAVVGGLVAAWPLVIAGVCGFTVAWWRGWPPRRLVAGAGWCVPMLAVFTLAAWAQHRGGWQAAAWSPFRAWERAWHALFKGEWVRAMVVIAPTAIPLGLLIAAGAWRGRVAMMAAGAAGWWPGAPVAFDEQQWRRQMAAAGQRVRAPGGVPVLGRGASPVIGATIRAVGHHPRPLLTLPYGALRTHMLLLGTTGAGKTTALIRFWAGFWAAATARYRRGREARPWLVAMDAKGGQDSRDTAARVRRVLRDLGATRIGIWPDEVALNLWILPPARLAEVLVDMVPVATEGAAAYYADVLASVVGLAVQAPAGPPGSSGEFLARLDPAWLAQAYAGDQEHAGEVTAAREHAGDVRLRYRTLFTRLGPGFDGDARVTDFDALYCIVEGTASVTVAEAQAQALVALVTDAAASWRGSGKRAGLLALDEFSAVSRRVPLHELTERCRSLGLAVQVAAQSWQSLAPDEDERSRLAATAAGGVWLMRCPDPEPACLLAGTRAVIETGRKIIGAGQYSGEGTGRMQRAWVADPDRARNFRAGQAAWIHGNACTYVQIAPYRPSPIPLPAAPEPAAPDPDIDLPDGAGGLTSGPAVPLSGGER